MSNYAFVKWQCQMIIGEIECTAFPGKSEEEKEDIICSVFQTRSWKNLALDDLAVGLKQIQTYIKTLEKV